MKRYGREKDSKGDDGHDTVHFTVCPIYEQILIDDNEDCERNTETHKQKDCFPNLQAIRGDTGVGVPPWTQLHKITAL